MGRASFEYDELGNTFYYVLVSFYALVLIPVTYFMLPFGSSKVVEVINENDCQCSGCVKKRKQKEANRPRQLTWKIFKFIALVVAWIVFFILVKKMSEIEVTHQEYDPYGILQIDRGAEVSEIKKAYRELSKKMHPDRGGDPVMFDKIAKAYQALTDDESRKNWELYGNPDGPTATTFGIALPKWLVSQEYGMLVLGVYGLIFIIGLPTVVGIWWYNSVKYNPDKVLLDTTRLFWHFLGKNTKMEVNRAVTVLSGAFEFCAQMNKDIVERESDNVELPRLIKYLPNVGENKKEAPFCRPYSLKARILMQSHFSRLPLDSESLAVDRRYMLTRIIGLVEEMISISQQIYFYTEVRLTTETIENLLKVLPMFVQGLLPKNSPLLQLPHLTEYNLQHLRRQRVFTCSDLANLDTDKRRSVLKSLSDEEFKDVLVVLSSMPRLSIQTHITVEGEDDAHEVTAGCVVTLKVTLTRNSLLDPQTAGIEDLRMKIEENDGKGSDDEDGSQASDAEEKDVLIDDNDAKPKRKPWEKQQPKKKKKGAAAGNKKKGKAQPVKKTVVSSTIATTTTEEKIEDEDDQEKNEEKNEEDGSDLSDEEAPEVVSNDEEDEYDDENWTDSRNKVSLEAKSHKTHDVHCPYYPGEKYEWWWLALLVNDKRVGRNLLAPVVSCKTLLDEQTVDLRFTAPVQKGVYNLQLVVRSDSYMDADYVKDIKLDVKAAKEIVLPKYEDDEEEENEAAVSSDEYTEDSGSDDE